MGNILVVEDEVSIQTVIRTYLENENYLVRCVDNGPEALETARQFEPDLIILDLNLPGMDGMEVAARLRRESDVYILMLTARTEEADRVAGLRLGADDYLTKPFSPRELVARVQAILRRTRRDTAPPGNTLCFGHVCIDPDQHEAWTPDQPIDLTTTEFKVLLELARHANRVLTRDQLIDRVWGLDFYGTDRVVDVYVGQVRRKLEQVTGASLIQTVRGVGYKFVDERQ
ncbi:MAG: Alkaline phosphatase synthesis transcriptional regulatory protein PhoP [Anaerolineae bacterium]|nr:Alkaline phosphatase synthesis transcriptional regulatory protein PhoP [Anaerolineae bacterium]